MDFKGTILLDASPALLAAINRIADVLSANIPLRNFTKPVFPETGALEACIETRAESSIKSAVQTAVASETEQVRTRHPEATPTIMTPAETEESPATKYTLVQVRKVMAEIQERMSNGDEKRAVTKKMRDILLSFGVESIGKLPEEMYEKFIQQISAL